MRNLDKPNPKHYAQARADALRKYPDLEGEDLEYEIRDILSDWYQQEAEDRRTFGGQEESESVANCDDYGTGEGQFHGRIG